MSGGSHNDPVGSHYPESMARYSEGCSFRCQTILPVLIYFAHSGWHHFSTGQNCRSNGSAKHVPSKNP